MNLSTPFPFDLISLPAWAETTIRNTRQAAAYIPIVIKAFSKTIAPVIATTAKDLSRYYWLCFQGAEAWTMDRQPISSGIRTVYTKLTSPISIANYRRLRTFICKTAMDALIVGLCGVVALSVGVDLAQKGYKLAQKGYRATEKFYTVVYARLNPSEPQPELLPSVEMAIASTEIAEALADYAHATEANIQAIAEVEAQAIAEVLPDFWAEPLPLLYTPPVVVGEMWNPAPKDMHQEVQRLFKLQYVPLTLPASELVVEQKLESRAQTKPRPEGVDELARELNVPGAIAKPKRERKPTKARANASASNGEAEAEANAPRGGRTAKG
jgi:hypothetical protein